MSIGDPQLKPNAGTKTIVSLAAGPGRVQVLPADTTRVAHIITNPLGSGQQAFLSFEAPGAPPLLSTTAPVELSPGDSLVDSGRGVWVGPISGNASGALDLIVAVLR